MFRKFVVIALLVAFAASAVIAPIASQSSGEQTPMIEKLLFFPSKFPEGDWTPKNLRHAEHFFTAADGTRLHAWYCPADNSRGTLLLAHGNAGNLATRGMWLEYLQSKAKLSVLIFDYRGYGKSEGKPTIAGALQDARAARDKLREIAAIKDSEMLLMGESLGGAIVAQLAAESAPRGLILQSTFSSLRDVADVHYPQLSWLVGRTTLDSTALISQVHAPILQSHGEQDRTIPFASGEKLFRAASQPKTFVSIPAADHNDWLTDGYLRELDKFIDSVKLPQPKSAPE